MRKIAAIFLVLALLTTVFVSCGKKDQENTTNPPLTASSIPTTQTPATVSPISTTAADNGNYTYVLTTSPDKTVPWGETTAFTTTVPTTETTTGIVIQIPTDNGVQVVQPNYSEASTTTAPAPTTAMPVPTNGEGSVATTKPTTTKPTTTKPVVKKAVAVETGGSAFNGDATTLYVDIDGSAWSSQFVANTMYLPAVIDGSGTDKKVKCTLSSTPDSANNYTITVDVSSLSLSPGAVLSINFPEGYIQTKSGTQYSNAFEINSTY